MNTPEHITADNPRDWTSLQPQTRRGHDVVILNVLASPQHLVGGRTIVAMYKLGEDEWALNSWFSNGRFYPGDRNDELDLLWDSRASTLGN